MGRIRNIRCIFHVFILLMLVGGGAGCASVQKDYERAENRDSISVWKTFLKKHPGSEHESHAQKRIYELNKVQQAKQDEERRIKKDEDDRSWERAKSESTIESYYAYLISHLDEGSHLRAALDSMVEKQQELINDIVDGDRSRIRPGSEFPLYKFKPQDVIYALGRKRLTQTTNTDSTTRTTEFVRIYRVQDPVSVTGSTKLVFVTKGVESFGVVARGKLYEGDTTYTSYKIYGVGYVIVNMDGRKTVYEF